MAKRLDEFRRAADALERGRMGRRAFLQRAAALGVSPMVAQAAIRTLGLAVPATGIATTAHAQGAVDRLVIASWGGGFGEAQRAAHFDPFTEETGIEVVLSSQQPEVALLEAQVQSGNVEWDLANHSLLGAATVSRRDLVQAIDYDAMALEIVAGVDPRVMTPTSVGIYFWSSNLGYSTIDFPDGGPQSWADFWNPEAFPGPRGLLSMDFEPPPLEIPLLATGISPEDLYPLDIDAAFAELTDFREHITRWTGYGADGLQLMVQGELAMSPAGNGALTNAISEGQPIGMTWNQAMLYYDAWVIPKGAPNPELAHRFIEFCMRPEVQAEFVKRYPVGAVTAASNAMLPEEIRARALSGPEHISQCVAADVSWWSEVDDSGKSNLEKVYDRWAAWIL